MKNHIVLTAAFMLCLCHLKAQPETHVSASLKERLSEEFSTAGNITWNRTGHVTYAQFRYQDQFWVAYFDTAGHLVATARKIGEPAHLPILVRQSLDEFRQHRGSGMAIGPVYELIQDDCARYLVILDGARDTYTVTFDSMGGRSIAAKTRKGTTPENSGREELIAKRIRR